MHFFFTQAKNHPKQVYKLCEFYVVCVFVFLEFGGSITLFWHNNPPWDEPVKCNWLPLKDQRWHEGLSSVSAGCRSLRLQGQTGSPSTPQRWRARQKPLMDSHLGLCTGCSLLAASAGAATLSTTTRPLVPSALSLRYITSWCLIQQQTRRIPRSSSSI